MYPVESGDSLNKVVATYELMRGAMTVEIRVHLVLAGRGSGRFICYLYWRGCLFGESWWGGGATEGEALRQTLLKVQGLPPERLMAEALEARACDSRCEDGLL